LAVEAIRAASLLLMMMMPEAGLLLLLSRGGHQSGGLIVDDEMPEAGLGHEPCEAAQLLFHVAQPRPQADVLGRELVQLGVDSVQLRLLLLAIAEGGRAVLRLLPLRLVPVEEEKK
jgi:hypothetical protein